MGISEILREGKKLGLINSHFYKRDLYERGIFNLFMKYDHSYIVIFGEDHERMKRGGFYKNRKEIIKDLIDIVLKETDHQNPVVILETSYPRELEDIKNVDVHRVLSGRGLREKVLKALRKYIPERKVVVLYIGRNHVRGVLEGIVYEILPDILFRDMLSSKNPPNGKNY